MQWKVTREHQSFMIQIWLLIHVYTQFIRNTRIIHYIYIMRTVHLLISILFVQIGYFSILWNWFTDVRNNLYLLFLKRQIPAYEYIPSFLFLDMTHRHTLLARSFTFFSLYLSGAILTRRYTCHLRKWERISASAVVIIMQHWWLGDALTKANPH